VSVPPSATTLLPMGASVGAELTSVTVMLTLESVLATPSENLTLKTYGEPVPPCASEGVQLN
jgi:hypothetical protein